MPVGRRGADKEKRDVLELATLGDGAGEGRLIGLGEHTSGVRIARAAAGFGSAEPYYQAQPRQNRLLKYTSCKYYLR